MHLKTYDLAAFNSIHQSVLANLPKLKLIAVDHITFIVCFGENDGRTRSIVKRRCDSPHITEKAILEALGTSFGMDWGFNSGPCRGRIAVLELDVIKGTGTLTLYKDIINWVYKLKTPGFTVGLVYKGTTTPYTPNPNEPAPSFEINLNLNSGNYTRTPNSTMEKLEYSLLPKEGCTYIFDRVMEEIPNFKEFVSERFGNLQWTSIEEENLIPEMDIMNLHNMEWVLKKPVLVLDLV